MQNRLKMFGLPVASLAVIMVAGVAVAAESGRAAYNVNRLNRGGMSSSQRMPVMPTLPINTTGNMTTDLPTQPVVPDTPDKPDVPDTPDTPDEPTPECPDGGVKNSEYTVDNCMRDVYACVNNGALPNGINDMFNEELRNSIINGMGLCTVKVERCVAEVRRDCENIYHSSADVWIDFNTRKVQPEYYSFVLRKTGLTPRQAENTCWLLDKNTYGSAFDAVANSGITTYEYNNRVGAYNGQGGAAVIKKNPQGATLNNGNNGVDGGRGHYARWDATTAECHIRVGAYNKDTPIKNSWLFGAVGDDRLAEAWTTAGSTFTWNKDPFGFSLYKNTNTVAVVGVGGGTLLGAGIGALAGHGDREFDCGNDSHREKLYAQLKGNFDIVNKYMTPATKIQASSSELTQNQCEALVELYNKYKNIRSAVDLCKERKSTSADAVHITAESDFELSCTVNNVTINMKYENGKVNITQNPTGDLDQDQLAACYKTAAISAGKTGINVFDLCVVDTDGHTFAFDLKKCAEKIEKAIEDSHDAKIENTLSEHGQIEIGGQLYDKSCVFKPINLDAMTSSGIYCGCTDKSCASGCMTYQQMDFELQELDTYIANLSIEGDKNNRVKTTLTGAAIGAGTGGLATAITAFVEKNNINCRLGDGLEQIGYGKSMRVGTLRDFYVKWNLRLPENVAPTSMVVDCNSWRRACAEITDLEQCKSAQINYKPATAPAITLIHAACIPSGSVCIENYPVAKSYGACVPKTQPDDDKDASGKSDAEK